MPLQNLDLNRLRPFASVFRHGSLLQASRELGVTSSAVGQSIRALEAELGYALFARIGKRYLPEPAARELNAVIDPFFRALGGRIEAQRTGRAVMRGTLRVGGPHELGTRRLISAIAGFRRRHEGVRFEVSLGDTRKLVEQVLDNRLDLALCDDGPYLRQLPQLQATTVFREPLVLAASREYAERAVGDERGYERLAGLELIRYHDGREAIYKWFKHHFGRAPGRAGGMTIDHPRGVATAVRLGLGLGVLPLDLVRADVARGKVVIIEPPGSAGPLVNPVHVVRLGDHIETPAERAFVGFLRKRLARSET